MDGVLQLIGSTSKPRGGEPIRERRSCHLTSPFKVTIGSGRVSPADCLLGDSHAGFFPQLPLLFKSLLSLPVDKVSFTLPLFNPPSFSSFPPAPPSVLHLHPLARQPPSVLPSGCASALCRDRLCL